MDLINKTIQLEKFNISLIGSKANDAQSAAFIGKNPILLILYPININ